jgi:hypothetical protein
MLLWHDGKAPVLTRIFIITRLIDTSGEEKGWSVYFNGRVMVDVGE